MKRKRSELLSNLKTILLSHSKKSHYLKYLPVFLVVILIFEFLDLPFLSRIYIYLGFCWPFAILAPELNEKILVRKYRYSFIKLAFKFNSFICGLFPVDKQYWSDPLIRSLSPLLFCMLLGFLSNDWVFILSIVGSALFEGSRYGLDKLLNS